MLKSLKSMFARTIYKLIKPPKVRINNSNSQAGEDRILVYLFGSLGLNKLTYIDIGANDPVLGNNTFVFSGKQHKGVLIEPNPSLIDNIKSARPMDIVIQAAVSAVEGETEFYIFNESALSTLSKAEADIRCQSGRYVIKEVKRIRLIKLESIITDYLDGILPHFVSLDVEGVDFQILSAFDFTRFPIPVWVIETCEYSESHIKPKSIAIIELMKSKGYFVYGDTYINTIFVRIDWFNNYNGRAAKRLIEL